MDESGNDQQLTIHNIKAIGHKYTERITDDAVIRVAYEEEQRIGNIFRLAKVMARHDGRKTVKEEDVRAVYQFIEEAENL